MKRRDFFGRLAGGLAAVLGIRAASGYGGPINLPCDGRVVKRAVQDPLDGFCGCAGAHSISDPGHSHGILDSGRSVLPSGFIVQYYGDMPPEGWAWYTPLIVDPVHKWIVKL